MSKTKIPQKVSSIIWGRAAGRCSMCNKVLYRDSDTLRTLNLAELAHNIPDSPNGPRGNGDEAKSKAAAKDPSNILLLCKECHDKVDDKANADIYPEGKLRHIKAHHEQNVEYITRFLTAPKSHAVVYTGKIGHFHPTVNIDDAAKSMLDNNFRPAECPFIDLSLYGNGSTDTENAFWQIEEGNLVSNFNSQIRERLKNSRDISHISLFAFATIPLLIKLGTLINDIKSVEVYQKHREPDTWGWLKNQPKISFEVKAPIEDMSKIALVLSLSGEISCNDIHKAVGKDVSIWHLKIDSLGNDCIKSKQHLSEFRNIIRTVFDRIKSTHGTNKPIHIFPAIPISVAVEIGRVWMPKADLPMIIYDRNRDNNMAFEKAITIGI